MNAEQLISKARRVQTSIELLAEKLNAFTDPNCFRIDDNVSLHFEECKNMLISLSELANIYEKGLKQNIEITI